MTAIPIAEKCNIKLDKRPALSQGPLGIEEVPDRKHLYDQYGNYLSTVSTQSANKMRTYNEFANMISEGMSDYRNHLEVKDEIHADGKRFSRIVKFPNETFDFSVNGKVEPYMLVMWAWTSYDLGWAEQYIFGPLCIICFNGQFTAAWKIQALSKKNWTKKADMSADDIATAIDTFQTYPNELETMAKVNVTNDEVKTLFEKTLAKKVTSLGEYVSDYVMKNLSPMWDSYRNKFGQNLYSVYQTATDWASHQEGRGVKMNKIRNRSSNVVDMCKSKAWLNLKEKETTRKMHGIAPREILTASNF